MNAAQRSSLARRNGSRGGKARVRKLKSTLQGQGQMKRNALKSCERQKGIYGRLFVNRAGIARVNAARLEARVNGGKASQQAQRAKKNEKTTEPETSTQETSRTPVTYTVNQREEPTGAATYKG
jgi:hypothetical protein